MSDPFAPAGPGAAAYADPAPILRDVLQRLRPGRKIRLPDHAREKRWISNPGGGYTGRWSDEQAPYLAGPMAALDNRRYDTVVVVGPGQSAKTTIAENWLHWAVDVDPAPLLWYMQSDAALEAYVKTRIRKLIDDHPALSSRLGGHPSDDTLHFKRFAGMHVEFLSATYNNLISKPAPRINVDELDAFPTSLGSIIDLLEIRRRTYGAGSKILATSHPDRAAGLDPARHWTAGIMLLYRDSTRARWFWACPDCGEPSSPTPGPTAMMDLIYETDPAASLDDVADSARLLCPHCGVLIEDHQRHEMSRTGTWVHHGQVAEPSPSGVIAASGDVAPNTTAGFWIVGAMSLIDRNGIPGLARSRVRAERDWEQTGSDEALETLKTIWTKGWGLPFAPPSDQVVAIDAEELRRRPPATRLGVIPAGPGGKPMPGVLIVAIDVQLNRFAVQVEFIGPHLATWVIDRFDIAAPAVDPSSEVAEERVLEPHRILKDWNRIEDRVLNRAWPLAAAPGWGLRPAMVLIDSVGAEGVTPRAYAFWRRQRRKGRHKRIRLVHGHDGLTGPRVAETFPDSKRRDRRAEARGEIPVLSLAVNKLKDEVSADLAPAPEEEKTLSRASVYRFAEGLSDAFFREYAAEEKTGKRWERKRRRNESFDLSVYARAGVIHLKLDRIDWSAPPDAVLPGRDSSLAVRLERTAPPDEGGGVLIAADDQSSRPRDLSDLVGKMA